jgi:hypothetical protein
LRRARSPRRDPSLSPKFNDFTEQRKLKGSLLLQGGGTPPAPPDLNIIYYFFKHTRR